MQERSSRGARPHASCRAADRRRRTGTDDTSSAARANLPALAYASALAAGRPGTLRRRLAALERAAVPDTIYHRPGAGLSAAAGGQLAGAKNTALAGDPYGLCGWDHPNRNFDRLHRAGGGRPDRAADRELPGPSRSAASEGPGA